MKILRRFIALFWLFMFLIAGFGSFLNFSFAAGNGRASALIGLAICVVMLSAALGALVGRTKPTRLLQIGLVVGAMLQIGALVAFTMNWRVPLGLLFTSAVNPFFERVGFSVSWLNMAVLMFVSAVFLFEVKGSPDGEWHAEDNKQRA